MFPWRNNATQMSLGNGWTVRLHAKMVGMEAALLCPHAPSLPHQPCCRSLWLPPALCKPASAFSPHQLASSTEFLVCTRCVMMLQLCQLILSLLAGLGRRMRDSPAYPFVQSDAWLLSAQVLISTAVRLWIRGHWFKTFLPTLAAGARGGWFSIGILKLAQPHTIQPPLVQCHAHRATFF